MNPICAQEQSEQSALEVHSVSDGNSRLEISNKISELTSGSPSYFRTILVTMANFNLGNAELLCKFLSFESDTGIIKPSTKQTHIKIICWFDKYLGHKHFSKIKRDGPTPSLAYNMVQVGNAQIAPGAVTTTKIATGAVSSTDVAQSFMKRVTLLDDAAGNFAGWNPDGASTDFVIFDPTVSGVNTAFIEVQAENEGSGNFGCDPTYQVTDGFFMTCSSLPPEFAELHYVVLNLPANVAS